MASNPPASCPNCRQPMQSQDLERHDRGVVQVDLCFTCAGIWFDHLASVELAPGAVVDLFKEIYGHRDDPRRAVATELRCPRCPDTLTLSYDLSKAGRFTYFRCPQGDGRFTPFYQFLREKQFVRSLTPAEIERVRSQVRQIKCSQCGAPIDLEHDSECKYCRAPVSFLDPEAVQKAVQMWSAAENQLHAGPTPEALGKALMQAQLHSPAPGGTHLGDGLLLGGVAMGDGTSLGIDLVDWGIHAIGNLLARHG
ncbi:MAG TPA: zf-TFIIB domain-containing protein [Steroidobacteraceae bacterium]|nr:zf-TFIIB domain-containing protein [Steroidobacteraceae bacterium]